MKLARYSRVIYLQLYLKRDHCKPKRLILEHQALSLLRTLGVNIFIDIEL